MMRAELLTIGSELLSGTTVDTNSAVLSRQLSALGIACVRRTSVPDEPHAIAQALEETIGRSELLVVTGGLGPTCDDITIAAIAKAVSRPLTYQPVVAQAIRRFYTRRNRKLQKDALRQAYIPKGGLALPNTLGTAPGLWLEMDKTLIVALPGVPSEMQALLDQEVLPRLRKRTGLAISETLTLRTAGVVELHIEHLLRRLRVPDSVQIGLYPHLKTVDLRLTGTGTSRAAIRRILQDLERKLRRELKDAIYGTGEERIEAVIGRMLLRKKQTLALAESCTGGVICDRLTNIPGSSRYLQGAVVAYHNALKANLLGVSGRLLSHRGAVSAAVARAMARGVRAITGASIGLSITGIAGPTGGTPTKPVGLVYLGISDARGSRTWRCRFYGTRETVKAQAAQIALNTLRLYLLDAERAR